jgi:ribulose-bisphosphate carboxylase large chain
VSDRFYGTYRVETPFDIDDVVAEMAGEQSTSTSARIPGETAVLIRDFGARVESIEIIGRVDTPSLPLAAGMSVSLAPIFTARVVLSWPVHNIGLSLPMLWTTLLGNQTGMRRLTAIRLEHLFLPPAWCAAMPRPAFGIEGTRRLTGVHGRPLIGSIVKPNIGLVPAQTADVVRTLAEGGIDFVKDDELMANPTYSPLEARVAAVMRVVNEVADRTGRKVMVAFNITDDADAMKRHHDTVLAAGGTCVMVNLNSIGLAALVTLRRHAALPIHGHRAGWAMMTRSPALGLSFQPYQLVHRLAGVDQLHVSGLGGKFWEDAASVTESARLVLTPILPDDARADRAMPVVSGGSKVFHAAPTFEALGSVDLIYAAGGAVFGHPDGITAGCASLREAWEAAVEGVPLKEYAQARPALAAAMAHADPVKA